MIENVLSAKSVTAGKKVTVRSLVIVGVIALAVALPQLVHLTIGQPGGVQWLPMYLPVLLGGCLLGWKYGAIAGAASPIVSFAITSLLGSPMPPAARLPFMTAELLIFALVSGLFSGKIYRNGLWAFPAVIAAQLCGRGAFLLLTVIFNSLTALTPQMVWSQIAAGKWGLLLQAVVAPLLIIAIRALLVREKKND